MHPTSTMVAAEGGWIGGAPDWRAAAGDGDLEMAAESAAPADFAVEGGETSTREESASVQPGGGTGGDTEPSTDRPVDDSPLRAGSVDDNIDYPGFLAYLERINGLGVMTRELDPTGRSIITVTTADGRPAPGEVVEVSAGEISVSVRTTADGTVRFHPAFYGILPDATLSYRVARIDGDPISAPVGVDVALSGGAAAPAAPVPLDVLFLLDATGSMGDEIDRLKATIDVVAERVATLDPAPDVRFAMTLYRDEGDAFVTANYDFTGDIDEFRSALADAVADGGGDYPEALDEGLADALAKPAWRDPSTAVQLIFVVADAPPQVGRQVATPYTDSIRNAIERGIKIFPIASSESDDQAEAVFRQMAQATGAPFVFLSNGAAGASTGASTDIATTDYEELALDELVVRLIAEELSDLQNGAAVSVPTTTAPATTNPDGQ